MKMEIKPEKELKKIDSLPEGQYHMGVDIWIKNNEGMYLIQKRSFTKKRMSDKCTVTGESTLELHEE